MRKYIIDAKAIQQCSDTTFVHGNQNQAQCYHWLQVFSKVKISANESGTKT